LDFAVALIAVLKTGAAILPLDSNYPRERLEWMLADSQALLLLSFRGVRGNLPESAGTPIIFVDDPTIATAVSNCSAESAPEFTHSPENLAYVIYTSGSTGKPKGVEVTYRALLSHNLAIIKEYALSERDTVLQFTPLSFDISIEEMLPTWLTGAKLI